jgi:hypothetical protein
VLLNTEPAAPMGVSTDRYRLSAACVAAEEVNAPPVAATLPAALVAAARRLPGPVGPR